MKLIIKVLLVISALITFLIALMGLTSHTQLLNTEITKKAKTHKECEIVFMHGYELTDKCDVEYRSISGGKLGGHVEIKLDEFYYGFNKTTSGVSIFPKAKSKSIFEKYNQMQWDSIRGYAEYTIVKIPLSKSQYDNLKISLNNHNLKTKSDYALIGFRCTSYLVRILSDTRVISKIPNLSAIFSYFYPEILRDEMVKLAKKNDLKIRRIKGVECLDWEY